MPHEATSLTSWARCIRAALDERGIDGLALIREAGLDPALLADNNARYPLAGTARLWQLAVAACGEDAFGLTVGRYVNHTSFHALGYSLLASATLKDAFERLVRYFRIVSDAAELRFERHGEIYRFSIEALPGDQQPAAESLDALLSVLIRLCRFLHGPGFRALAVRLRRPAPADTLPYERVFKAPVEFAASDNAIDFERASLERPLASANPELARHNDAVIARYLANFETRNVSGRVHAALVDTLPHGEPSQDAIAARLHMSSRNLQRRLAEEGETYKEILNRTRQDLALSYIRDPAYSVSEITYLLGFSDTSSFSRAFKRWTGRSPRHFREQPT